MPAKEARRRRRPGTQRGSLTHWSVSLHKSFRLLTVGRYTNDDLLAFLKLPSGTHKDEILANLPYDERRSRGAEDEDDEDGEADETGEGRPDDRRYRDLKQVLESCGLLWEDHGGRVRYTELGEMLRSFMPHANPKNVRLIAQYAAFGLSACQLRNPTGAGQRYAASVNVFPFRFIWEAMLQLDNRLDSEELNRAIFRTVDAESLGGAIERIKRYRVTKRVSDLAGERVAKINDRLIPVVSMAAFGWALIDQKERGAAGSYHVKEDCVRLLEAAVSLPAKHRDYDSVEAYVTAISNAACLPKDYR